MADDAEVQQAAKGRAEPADKSVTEDWAGLPPGADLRDEEELASHEAARRVLKRWRPLMFLIIFAIALAVGFYYKSNAAPGTETLKHKAIPPQTLNIYTSNPGTSVQVEVKMSPNSAGQYATDAVTFIVKSAALHPHLKIHIISSLQSHSFSRLASARGAPHRQRYYKEFTLGQSHSFILTPGPINKYALYGHFHLPNVLQESRGTIFGHLPSVEVADGGPTGDLLAQMTNSGSIRYIIYGPQGSESTAPGALPPAITPHSHLRWFHSPGNLSISESILGILPLLRSDQITYMTPPAKLQQNNYTWRSKRELEPTFEATDPGAADARSNASFTSGIAFSVAAAAAIALVQELPREIPRPGRFPAWARSLRLATWARRMKRRQKA